MSQVIVIGGGASGLMAALQCKKQGSEVLILERNNKLGKKYLLLVMDGVILRMLMQQKYIITIHFL